MKKKCVLTIAGSDSGAGAGIQSDLKTFQNYGLYGLTVITAVTAQNSKGIQKSFELPVQILQAQLYSVFDDFDIRCVKTGMLVSDRVVNVVSNFLSKKKNLRIIVDPVIYSKSKFVMLNSKGVNALIGKLLPISFLVTPNLEEAEILSGSKIRDRESLEKASEIIFSFGVKNVLIKGGHFSRDFFLKKGTDILFNGRSYTLFRTEISSDKSLHGIGCTLSSAITSNIALGNDLKSSIKNAKNYINQKLQNKLRTGNGWRATEI